VERGRRLPVLGATAVGLALGAGGAAPPPAAAAVLMTQAQALAQAFPGARVERRAFVLTEAQTAAIQARAKAKAGSRLVTAYLAWHGGALAGAAFFDTREVRTMPGTFMIVVAPDTTVARVDVLAFFEPSEYRPPARWLGLFGGRRLDDGLWPRRDIRNLSGATLSSRAVTEAVRLALASYEVLVAGEPVAAGAGKP